MLTARLAADGQLRAVDEKTGLFADPTAQAVQPVSAPAFGPLQEIEAGVLRIAYIDAGPRSGPALV